MPSFAIKAPQREFSVHAKPVTLSGALHLRVLAAFLGVLSVGSFLCSHNIADGDLWAKLALGAHVWKYADVPLHDVFAFTPVLPQYVDHEWGAGTIFFGLLNLFGPGSLMWLKIVLCFGAMSAALAVGRRAWCEWGPLLLLAIPSAACVVLGYIPVIRSHAFTYFFFAVTLLCLEEIMARHPPRSRGWGRSWPVLGIVVTMLFWVNIHGGFVAGLGTIAIYLAIGCLQAFRSRMGADSSEVARDSRWATFALVLFGSILVTCVNPYGVRFWLYLLPAVLAKRPFITEWQPLPFLGKDPFVSFRILFLLVALLILVGWKKIEKRSWTGLAMLAVTGVLAWRSRRHAPFFGVASLAFAGPYLTGTLLRIREWLSALVGVSPARQSAGERAVGRDSVLLRLDPSIALVAIYGLIAFYAAFKWLPESSFQVLAPVGHDPVREVDILSLAQARGNLATPFHWGSYSAWRLHPNIKISMDGRYEAAFPESTFLLNARFFDKAGDDWDRLIRDYPVDYVILDLSRPGLRPVDLATRGYSLVWVSEGCSALMALEKQAHPLQATAAALPPTTINPLDPTLPARWWP